MNRREMIKAASVSLAAAGVSGKLSACYEDKPPLVIVLTCEHTPSDRETQDAEQALCIIADSLESRTGEYVSTLVCPPGWSFEIKVDPRN